MRGRTNPIFTLPDGRQTMITTPHGIHTGNDS